MFDIPVAGADSAEATGTLVSFSLERLAEECAIKTKYEKDEAAQMLLRRLQIENAALYQEKQREAMIVWARGAIDYATRRVRTHIASPQQTAQPLSSETMRDLAASWFDWPVRPGIPLRDATRAVLMEASGVYLRDSKVYAARGSWFAAISKLLPNAKAKVGEVLDERTVERLAVECNVSGG